MFDPEERNTKKRVVPGLSCWVNLLDYSCAVLPVMLADKNIDVADVGYEPKNPTDEKVLKACELCILF